jgi:hypothetical protein
MKIQEQVQYCSCSHFHRFQSKDEEKPTIIIGQHKQGANHFIRIVESSKSNIPANISNTLAEICDALTFHANLKYTIFIILSK